MFRYTKLKFIILLIFSLNALHHFMGAYFDFCKDVSSYCVVTLVQKVYIIFAFLIFPIKLLLYPIDILSYSIVKIDFVSFLLSLIMYWMLISVLVVIFRKNRVLFFIFLSFLASITLGVAFS
jgi:hypothetical protein